MLQQEAKYYPAGDVREGYRARKGVPAREEWFEEATRYEAEVPSKRG